MERIVSGKELAEISEAGLNGGTNRLRTVGKILVIGWFVKAAIGGGVIRYGSGSGSFYR